MKTKFSSRHPSEFSAHYAAQFFVISPEGLEPTCASSWVANMVTLNNGHTYQTSRNGRVDWPSNSKLLLRLGTVLELTVSSAQSSE